MSRRLRVTGILVLMLALLVALPGWVAWSHLFASEPAEEYSAVEDLFKYGSLGVERAGGMPYWVWKVMPEVFPNLLPDPTRGYEQFGFLYEPGRDLPLGMTKVRIGFDRVGSNCAMCHISHYRVAPDSAPVLFLSGANASFDPQAYFSFLLDAVNEWRFNADTLLTYIDRQTTLGAVDRALYRRVLIPKMQAALREAQNRYSWWYKVPPAGPGRWVEFNDLKFHYAGMPQDRSVGNSDIPTLWNMKPRAETGNLHWDALFDDMSKSARGAVLASGASGKDVRADELERLVAWWKIQPAPEWPFPVDGALAASGAEVWTQTCASCHEIGNPTAGRVIPIDEIGTDRSRYDLLTPETVERYNGIAGGLVTAYGESAYDGDLSDLNIRKSEGYVAMLLDGVWMRAPYLHNGSVPTLADLLEPPARRPSVFHRGYDVYDTDRVGYVSSGPEAEAVGFRYDTSVRGNGNGGHLYGTDLPPASKRSLIEYLKTL